MKIYDFLSTTGAVSPLSRLRRFASPPADEERCDLCAAAISPDHQHLLERRTRKLICACDACSILFDNDQAGRYQRIHPRICRLSEFDFDDQIWAGLGIPINLAFFYHSEAAERVVAMYPSPGGATESLLALDAWEELVRANPACGELASDVEALLINRVGSGRDAFIVSIDHCYRLVGLIRRHWHGLTGGTEVWRAVNGFFDDLRRSDARTGGKRNA